MIDAIAVVNYNDSPGIIENNVTDPTAFATPSELAVDPSASGAVPDPFEFSGLQSQAHHIG